MLQRNLQPGAIHLLSDFVFNLLMFTFRAGLPETMNTRQSLRLIAAAAAASNGGKHMQVNGNGFYESDKGK